MKKFKFQFQKRADGSTVLSGSAAQDELYRMREEEEAEEWLSGRKEKKSNNMQSSSSSSSTSSSDEAVGVLWRQIR